MTKYRFKKGFVAQEQSFVSDGTTMFHSIVVGDPKDVLNNDVLGIYFSGQIIFKSKQYNNRILCLSDHFTHILKNIQKEIVFTDEMIEQIKLINQYESDESIKQQFIDILKTEEENHTELKLLEIKMMFGH